eukprot:858109-Prymnesium_polylepis.1
MACTMLTAASSPAGFARPSALGRNSPSIPTSMPDAMVNPSLATSNQLGISAALRQLRADQRLDVITRRSRLAQVVQKDYPRGVLVGGKRRAVGGRLRPHQRRPGSLVRTPTPKV